MRISSRVPLREFRSKIDGKCLIRPFKKVSDSSYPHAQYAPLATRAIQMSLSALTLARLRKSVSRVTSTTSLSIQLCAIRTSASAAFRCFARSLARSAPARCQYPSLTSKSGIDRNRALHASAIWGHSTVPSVRPVVERLGDRRAHDQPTPCRAHRRISARRSTSWCRPRSPAILSQRQRAPILAESWP